MLKALACIVLIAVVVLIIFLVIMGQSLASGGGEKALYTPDEMAAMKGAIDVTHERTPDTVAEIRGSLPYIDKGLSKYAMFQMHFGQRKLMVHLVEFLSRHGDKASTVVYAGAAPGHYFPTVSTLFPAHRFVLYDPNPFGQWCHSRGTHGSMPPFPSGRRVDAERSDARHPPSPSGRRVDAERSDARHPTFETVNEYFTDETAHKMWERFRGDMLFVSDIRRTLEGWSAFERGVDQDNRMNLGWVDIMKPRASALKFRPPFDQTEPVEMRGILYLQAWAPKSSTETRMEFTADDEPSLCNPKDYEEKLRYHNVVTRDWADFQMPSHLIEMVPGLGRCSDCAREMQIWKIFLKSRGEDPNDDNIARLMNLATKATNQKLTVFPHGVQPSTPNACKRMKMMSTEVVNRRLAKGFPLVDIELPDRCLH